MDYNILLDLATDLGYELALSGAETYRVEDSINHVLSSYGVASEVFSVPNYLIVSIITETGKPITRMRRIGFHGNNLDAVERLNAFSRRICAVRPEPKEAMAWLEDVRRSVKRYGFPVILLGDFLGAAGFGILFGCSFPDAFFAGLCGILIGLIQKFTDSLKANPFFSTLSASFLMAMLAYSLNVAGIVQNSDTVIIGALMILVPGLLFTNALRDIIYGDTNSGTNRCVQVLLIAGAMALGTAFARNLVCQFRGAPQIAPAVSHSFLVLCLAALSGCIGFSILFNIHSPGSLLCALGGIVAFAVYDISLLNGSTEIMSIFWGTAFSAIYSEIMARVRKYPTICYLVVSIFPLIPGASLYYTMCYAVDGDLQMFVHRGLYTAELTGIMAASILLVSSMVRLYTTWKKQRE